MAQFSYTAKRGLNETLEGSIEAESQDVAVMRLVEQGLFPVRIEAARPGPAPATGPSRAGAPAAAPSAPAATPAAVASAPTANRAPIKSPMVGTFYRAPAPDAPPFVDAGQTIEVGQVICIIEAMKLMNEIKAEVRGRIVEMPVQNGDPVEFGQPLFIVEPL